ncbi:chromosome segregation protein SMC [Fructilactobacillus fructivorans]|uniref:Chromosome partition protein Smc n=1 Tax=Fructilactobacillus fructivorans TaxID=1614 RepID=A0A0C1PN30_9LACO|nr:chromosome segregation protein SMC [Fructilactobacillus fructivorans]KID42167.1 Chromosome partition protein smc [Fructilactobacillus fructivorans]MCT0152060.1 chromosome segregation protein SMC [Fructilactobacillus fructivorans]MCT2867952.1 chromosome segregation protein SMC [Fructilactobacillus fructivorans]MCT2868466.1 chromosome segregation protein SMC [Fructilactobacillus fructivorans]MCT2873466.1 chromosome segregation protein SMC [Fructilactobacillus fructivorans]
MKLKSIEIAGFKSFADKTTIDFQDGLTGIVGPNGSGKSNVIEAIRWVLGEQSAKTLRGKKMLDVIFSGSKGRRALNRAEVSIDFDNSDHFLDSDFTEIKITRKVYRNGESSYSINDKECRLKDINNLFMDTGLGEGSLSIISQGNVDEILNDNAEKRRSIIETAAGVYRYKKQKNETEQKLADTQGNLDRISDIINELDKQMGPLKQQSENASLYLSKKKYLDRLEYSLLTFQIKQHEDSRSSLNFKLKQQQNDYNKLKAKVNSIQSHKRKLTLKINELSRERESLQNQLLNNTKKLESANSAQKLSKQRREFNQQKNVDLKKELKELRIKLDDVVQNINDNQSQINKKRTIISKLNQEIRESRVAHFKERLVAKQAELEDTRNDYIDLMQSLAEAKNDLKLMQKLSKRSDNASQEKEQRIVTLDKQASRLRQQLDVSKQEFLDLTDDQKRIASKLEQVNGSLASSNKKTAEMRKRWYGALRVFQETKTERDSIKSMLENHNSLYRGIRNLLKEKQDLPGIKGTVSDFIEVPDKYVFAIETALGSRIQQVITRNVHDARDAIKYLNKNKLGRVTFLPMNAVNERYLTVNILNNVSQMDGFVGVAADLVKMPSEMTRVKNHLLGGIIIANDLKTANGISKAINHRNQIVTLNGEVINAGGSITGGSNRNQANGLLSQKEKLTQLNLQVDQMDQKMNAGEKAIKRAQGKQKDLQLQHDQMYQELSEIKSKIKVKQGDINASQKSLRETQRDADAFRLQLKNAFSDHGNNESDVSQKIDGLKLKIKQNQTKNTLVKNEIKQLNGEVSKNSSLISDIKERLILAKEQNKQLEKTKNSLIDQRNSLKNQLSELTSNMKALNQSMKQDDDFTQVDVLALKKQIDEIKVRLTNLNHQVNDASQDDQNDERQINQGQDRLISQTQVIQKLKARVKVVENNLISEHQRLQTSFNEDQSIEPVDFNLDKINSLIQDYQRKIDSLGPININSIDDYSEIKERYDFMNHQLEDLIESKKQLVKIMNQMDQTVKVKFNETYDKIATAFSRIFRNIFGGGEARLKMDDPHHLLTTGIDILVKPPGKRYRNLNLLSGGEKALTALALLFSVLEVKPVPFVILDEAESALDPANVDRFARYIQSLKDKTQFIVITHRKETMVYADYLYGVTMQDSGVSKVVSVNLDESKKLGEK